MRAPWRGLGLCEGSGDRYVRWVLCPGCGWRSRAHESSGTHSPGSSAPSRVPRRGFCGGLPQPRCTWAPLSLECRSVSWPCEGVCQEQGEGLSWKGEPGTRWTEEQAVSDGTLHHHGCPGTPRSSLLRSLQGSHWVRWARKPQGARALMLTVTVPGASQVITPPLSRPLSWGCLCPSKGSP